MLWYSWITLLRRRALLIFMMLAVMVPCAGALLYWELTNNAEVSRAGLMDVRVGTNRTLLQLIENDGTVKQRVEMTRVLHEAGLRVSMQLEAPEVEVVAGNTYRVAMSARDWLEPSAGPSLHVREGKIPSSPQEVAVTPALAEKLNVRLGDTFHLRIKPNYPLTLVGLATDPTSGRTSEKLFLPLNAVQDVDVLSLLMWSSPDSPSTQVAQKLRDAGILSTDRDDLKTRGTLTRRSPFLIAGSVIIVLGACLGAIRYVTALRGAKSRRVLRDIGARPSEIAVVAVAQGVMGALGGLLVATVVWLAARGPVAQAAADAAGIEPVTDSSPLVPFTALAASTLIIMSLAGVIGEGLARRRQPRGRGEANYDEASHDMATFTPWALARRMTASAKGRTRAMWLTSAILAFVVTAAMTILSGMSANVREMMRSPWRPGTVVFVKPPAHPQQAVLDALQRVTGAAPVEVAQPLYEGQRLEVFTAQGDVCAVVSLVKDPESLAAVMGTAPGADLVAALNRGDAIAMPRSDGTASTCTGTLAVGNDGGPRAGSSIRVIAAQGADRWSSEFAQVVIGPAALNRLHLPTRPDLLVLQSGGSLPEERIAAVKKIVADYGFATTDLRFGAEPESVLQPEVLSLVVGLVAVAGVMAVTMTLGIGINSRLILQRLGELGQAPGHTRRTMLWLALIPWGGGTIVGTAAGWASGAGLGTVGALPVTAGAWMLIPLVTIVVAAIAAWWAAVPGTRREF